MKKILLSIACLLTLTLTANAQAALRATAQIDLHGNQVRARLLNGGDLFWDLSRAIFETDTTSPGIAAMFASSIWMGGYDSGGNLKMAGQTYRQSGNDFWPGPLDANGTTTRAVSAQWDKIWHVTGYEVRRFIADYNNNIANACVSSNIFKWPGRNNPHSLQANGFALPANQDFAPFFDRNNDGIYDPTFGDYPIVPNTNGSLIADDLAWTVFNDEGAGGVHTETRGLPLRAEVQASFYAFNYLQYTFLNNTMFAHYKVINKSASRIDSLYIGMWQDPDLGCYNDDYIGSSPQNNTMFCYNADAYDDIACSNGGSMGYGTDIPAMATTFLNRPMTKATYYINNTAPAPPPGQSNPSTAGESYGYLSGSWRDGTRFTTGGDAYNVNSTSYTNHVYSGNPNNPNLWSMNGLFLTPRDFRMISATYFPTWQPQEAKELTMAFGTHKGGDNLASVAIMYNNLPVLQTFYNNNYQLPGLSQDSLICTNSCVYAGDANADGTVNNWDYLYPATSYTNTGPPRANRFDSYFPTNAANWTGNLANNLNKKHLDCDGNGVVNVKDMAIVTQNQNNAISCLTPALPNAPNVQFYMVNRYGQRADTLSHITAQVASNYFDLRCNIPNNDFYGIAFTMELDDSIFITSPSITRQKPTLNYGTYKQVFNAKTGQSGRLNKWDIVMTPTNSINTGTNTNLLRLYASTYQSGGFPDGTTGHITFSNVRIIKNDGTILWNYGMQDQAIVLMTTPIATENTKTLLEESSVYPNPVENNLTVDLGEADHARLRLFDIAGSLLIEKQITDNKSLLDVSKLSQGVYLLELSNEIGKTTHCVVK